MANSRAVQLVICLQLTAFSVSDAARGQAVPVDLDIRATIGNLIAPREHATIHVSADGSGSWGRFVSDLTAFEALESGSLVLSAGDVEGLWQAVESNGFFEMDPSYSDNPFADGIVLRMSVVADGVAHSVRAHNESVAALRSLLESLNAVVPEEARLLFEVPESYTVASVDICSQAGKNGPSPLGKADMAPGWLQTGEAGVEAISAADGAVAHPGTVIAHGMSLDEAVDRGIASISSKGTYWGDGASITIDNTGDVRDGPIHMVLFIEFWGDAATESLAGQIEYAIESKWAGIKTSSGDPVTIDVRSRVRPGGFLPPFTSGYHQIELVDSLRSYVMGSGSTFDVNDGVGWGKWRTTGPNADGTWAHEAGHLLGLPDRYDEFNKLPLGYWMRTHDSKIFTTEELALELGQYTTGRSQAELEAILLEEDLDLFTIPKPGFEGDLMAGSKNAAQDGDADVFKDLAAGVLVYVPAGSPLLSPEDDVQNLVVTHAETVYVPAGETKTLGGLYTACIDELKNGPNEGYVLDVGPPLSDWQGIEAASLLGQLLEYIDRGDHFCTYGYPAQNAIWRVTDNEMEHQSDVDEFLLAAGIDVGERMLDFPRLSNPHADDPTTGTVVSEQLIVSHISSDPEDAVLVGETVSLTGSAYAPDLEGASTAFEWALTPPSGSLSVLTSDVGETTDFTPDRRGLYEVILSARVENVLPTTVIAHSAAFFAVADALTETFESGSLESGPAFYWETDGFVPWNVSEGAPNSGSFSAASGTFWEEGQSALRTSFEQSGPGSISFAVKVSTKEEWDTLVFSIDGEETGRWWGDVDWEIAVFELPPGRHTAEWTWSQNIQLYSGREGAWIDNVFFPEDAVFTAIEDESDRTVPTEYALAQNYPNPFNPTTTITYSLPRQSEVALAVYDALGRTVRVVTSGPKPAGRHTIRFESSSLPSGMYVYRLSAGDFVATRRMVLIR